MKVVQATYGCCRLLSCNCTNGIYMKEEKTPRSLKKPISAKSWNIYTLLLELFLRVM